jgi:hypothetical protein
MFPQTEGEQYRHFGPNDLNDDLSPDFYANISPATTGVMTDFYGTSRTLEGLVTAGAVQVEAGGPPPPPPIGPPPGDSEPPGNDGGEPQNPDDPNQQGSGPIVIFADDFEDDLGWTVDNWNLLDGAWERGVPAGDGTRADPPTDQDGSGYCAVTGNLPGDADVDGGTTRLISPLLDATGGENPVIGFAVWFGHAPPDEGEDGNGESGEGDDCDHLEVRISNDDGYRWVFVERVPSIASWSLRTLHVADYVTPSDQVRVRFDVSDLGVGDIVEAGVDAFSLVLDEQNPPSRPSCTPPRCSIRCRRASRPCRRSSATSRASRPRSSAARSSSSTGRRSSATSMATAR